MATTALFAKPSIMHVIIQMTCKTSSWLCDLFLLQAMACSTSKIFMGTSYFELSLQIVIELP